uniref:hydroxyisourate hydrolase n=1 Tax=mine drainage metagenome TaxID=410659 RepID=E6QJZ5_9ZZZZ
MISITTHILDVVLGKPASGVVVQLHFLENGEWKQLAASSTDADGRCRDLGKPTFAGTYRLTFAVQDYFIRQNRNCFYPEIYIVANIRAEQHYHLPLLLSDNSYTTYRGS